MPMHTRAQVASNLVVMLLRFIVSAEIRRREDFFLPFIMVGRGWRAVQLLLR